MIRARKQFGFTLIEILVVTSIVGVVLGGGIAAYNNFNEQQKLLQGAKNFSQDLRLAQKKADSGEKPGSCTDTLTGYQVVGAANDTMFTISAICGAGIIDVSQKELSNGTYFVNDFTVAFRVLARGAIANPPTIVIRNSLGVTRSVNVGAGGAISVQE